jgi:hypothetical protein
MLPNGKKGWGGKHPTNFKNYLHVHLYMQEQKTITITLLKKTQILR